jgi:predicted DNA-binding WGR domain protein
MPDERPIQQMLVLHRIDPDRQMARFYSLMIERGLLGPFTLVRNWDWIGTACPAGTGGRERVGAYQTVDEAGQALGSPGAGEATAGIPGPLGIHIVRKVASSYVHAIYSAVYMRRDNGFAYH